MQRRLQTPRAPQATNLGYTLVELVLVLCIVAVLLALLAPKIMPVSSMAQQVRALTECKAVTGAVQTYAVLRGGGGSPGAQVDLFDYAVELSHDEVKQLLVPDYLHTVPELDPWDSPYRFYAFDLDAAAPLPHIDIQGPRVFMIRSPGANREFDDDVYVPGTFAPNDPEANDDIVCADGDVIQHAGNWDAR